MSRQTFFVQRSNFLTYRALGCNVAVILSRKRGTKCDPFPIQSND